MSRRNVIHMIAQVTVKAHAAHPVQVTVKHRARANRAKRNVASANNAMPVLLVKAVLMHQYLQ
jgi:hypothetical protein